MTELRICFVGDSLVLGTNDDHYLGWPGRLAQAERANDHDVTVYNLGLRGDTSEMVAARWRVEAQARLPDIYPGRWCFPSAPMTAPTRTGTVFACRSSAPSPWPAA